VYHNEFPSRRVPIQDMSRAVVKTDSPVKKRTVRPRRRG
jgi:hypothetical protein